MRIETMPVPLSPTARIVTRVCALVVTILGLLILLGWSLDLPVLFRVGSKDPGMAPITALLFVLYGSAIFLRTFAPRPALHWLGLILISLGTILASVLGLLNAYDIYPSIEHIGLSFPAHQPGVPPADHISPVTSICFLLASGWFLISLSKRSAKRWQFAWLLAVFLLMSSFVLILTHIFEMPLFYSGRLIVEPSLVTGVSFGLMAFALLAAGGPLIFSPKAPQKASKMLLLVFIVLTTGILASGLLVYRAYGRYYREQVEQQLSAVGELKVAELQQWRKERFSDAAILYYNKILQGLVRRFMSGSDAEAEILLRQSLGHYPRHFQYGDVRLMDPHGVTRLSFPENPEPASAPVIKKLREVVRSKQIEIVDFYRRENDNRISLSVLVPVLDPAKRGSVIAVIALQVDPESYLYPYVLRWPGQSKTAETVLVRRENDHVLLLSHVKNIKEAALNLRWPLTRTTSPSVMAVTGKTGIIDGIDFLNNPVIADLRPIEGSPWFLVTRISTSEAFAPMQLHVLLILGFVIALISGAGATVGFFWRRQNVQFYQKQAEASEALRESELIFAKFMEHSPIYVFFKDDQIRPIRLSRNYEQMLGRPISDLLGKTMDELFPSPMAKSMVQDDLRVLREGKVVEVKEELNGRYYRTIKFPIFLEGRPKYLAGYTIDVTEEQKAASDLLAAKNTAEEAARTKSKFLDIAAHELRNPVTAFSLLLQLIQKQVQKGEVISASTFARLKEPADRLTHLVIDLLDVSRLERGLMVVRLMRTDLASLVLSVVEEFRLQYPKRRFSFEKPSNSIEISLDPTRMNQVLSNLLDNAAKYTPAESPIDVNLEEGPSKVRVSVIDRGPGIPKEQLSSLFTAFSRGTSDSNLRASGLGLGLSVSRGIVELHGGKIGVESEMGRGSVFYFELPK